METELLDQRKKALIVPYDYRGISLLSASRKVYGRVLTERLIKVTEGKVSKEEGEFR